jgi:hypothetical protein
MKSSVLYQGLFLIAFALYADSRLHKTDTADSNGATGPYSTLSTHATRLPLALDLLRQELALIPIFRAKVPGVSLSILDEQVLIAFEGEDLYREGGVEIEAVWTSALEQIGTVVYQHLDPALELAIVGFGDGADQDGVTQGELRAKWIEHFFASQGEGGDRPKVKVRNGGKGSGVPRFELKVSLKAIK